MIDHRCMINQILYQIIYLSKPHTNRINLCMKPAKCKLNIHQRFIGFALWIFELKRKECSNGGNVDVRGNSNV